jgi:PhzF family phenazine biosynthesis protein
VPLFQVDAFSDRPFGGNPAAVCLLEGPAPEDWMQALGAEMNLSETAFLTPRADGFGLRWFTPSIEVALCGHATLASAHVLWETGRLGPGETARFHTRSGLLTATRNESWIELNFPAVSCEQLVAPPGLRESLGVSPITVYRGGEDYVVELASEAEVRGLTPDIVRLAEIDCRGVCVTAPASTAGFDFVSRFFGPRAGIPEDPVTGSAHCALGPLWGARLGQTELSAYQASPRGGVLRLRLAGGRVLISGQAVTVLRGELASP